ncbi:hypothetical protein CspHIS471_0408440 [Cutaneotrichosporon sp. HIS471]|nr:hypothetical protein CspHIS471_0408440 [Cutaneotrichosporon sp. HIS471]
MTKIETEAVEGRNLAEIADNNESEEKLHELGYKGELHRTRGYRSILSLSLTCMAIPYGYGTSLYTGVLGGGPLTLVWGSVIVTVLQWCVAVSLGELASRWPTSAGPYYWTFQLAPKRFRTLLSYINGWLVLTGVLLCTTAVAFGLAQHIVGAINITHPDWSPPQYVYILITYALLSLASIPLLLGPKVLAILEQINMVITWVFKIAHIVVLSAQAKAGRRSAKYAFTHYDPQYSGWGRGWTFFIGILPGAFANSAPGVVLSLTEETRNPATVIPRAMADTMLPWSLALVWAFILPLTFTMPSTDILLQAPNGIILPYAYKLIVGNDAGAICLMCGLFVIGFNCLIGLTCSASHQLWSFSRDHAVPGSSIWAKVTPSGNIPYAIGLCLLIQALLCLIDLGSTTALNSFFSTAINAFMAGYALPILLSLFEGRKNISTGPYFRRIRGLVCNIAVSVWAPFALILFSMPIAIPVLPTTMNYSAVVLMRFITIASVWYLAYARRVYQGPPIAAI